MTAKIVNFDTLDDDDVKFSEFIDELKKDAARAVFLVEKADGEVMFGTNSTERRDVVYDIYRLQELARIIVEDAE